MDYQKAINYIVNRLKAELPPTLRYHSALHTLSVLRNSRSIAQAEGVSQYEQELLLTAAAYHDAGFLKTYHHNEIYGCAIAEEVLPEFGYQELEIDRIKAMIMATQPPQNPKNKLEKILCDADLYYLGGDHYDQIAKNLREELQLRGNNLSEEEWLDLQIQSLQHHQYFTDYCQKTRRPKKMKRLEKLRADQSANTLDNG